MDALVQQLQQALAAEDETLLKRIRGGLPYIAGWTSTPVLCATRRDAVSRERIEMFFVDGHFSFKTADGHINVFFYENCFQTARAYMFAMNVPCPDSTHRMVSFACVNESARVDAVREHVALLFDSVNMTVSLDD